jgi:uncharacterized cysteine cluster protein YcgN (CxxCxxCC family)
VFIPLSHDNPVGRFAHVSKSTGKADSSVDNRGRDDYPTHPDPPALRDGFWRGRSLEDLSPAEWEALCDGCAKCCLLKLEYAAPRVVHYTNVRCRLLDDATCRCADYPNRSRRVADCVTLDPAQVREAYWLPRTCAYRLVAEGSDLPDWHPLVSGSPLSVRRSGNSVCGRTIAEEDAGNPEHHIVTWIRC